MKICALDIGTSRIKAALFSETGEMLSLVSQRLPRASSPHTQDAEAWYSISAQLLRELKKKASPDAIVLTGNMHALLGVDREGNPVENAVLWSDQSAQKESDELNARFGNTLLDDFGNRSIPVFTLPKIMKMKRERESLYRKTAKFLQSKDFVTLRLTGNAVTDPSDASGTLLMRYGSNAWAEDLCGELEIDPGKLPEILPSCSVCGHVTKRAAKETGIAAGTPVITGCGDLASAALGSGVNERTFSLTLGTAGQLLASGKERRSMLAGKVFVFAHADPEQELYLGSIPSGGFTFEYLSNLHNIPVSEFFHEAEKVPLSPDLPLFFPYILGKGAPSMQYESCGAWFGLSAAHTLPHLCRSAVFGVLASLQENSELLRSLGLKGDRLVLQALACREKVVRETANALFPQEKFLPENSEASLLGAAVIAFSALKVFPDLSTCAEKILRSTPLPPPGKEEKSVAELLYEKTCLYRTRI
ncbi:MAG: hypothetical protein J6A21_07395 [Lentisphaeria bacterium]|nr:hypothetical protein [Lentisphaeria bacterium]